MKKKYLNIFWAFLAVAIILNEFVIGQIQFKAVSNINWGTWVFVALWFSIAAKNIYSFYTKQFNLRQK
mgnify:CR=1 FL=1